MYVPKINIRTTNVELTNERRALILKRLAPVGRLLGADEQGEIDVVLRRERQRLGGTKYYLSLKLTTSGGSFHAVAIESRLERALTKARDVLRRSLSDGKKQPRLLPRYEGLHVVDHYRLMLGNH